MNDQVTNDQWPDRTLTPAQQENRASAALIPVSRNGAMPTNFAEMVDYAKFMSTAKGAVGAHLNGNVGACLAIMEIANQFDMPAYAVARQSYLVNGRVAFMGQFFHAIINKYCPLKQKLTWSYTGEGDTRRITISGEFKNENEPRIWTSPMVKDIPVKNSPLWKSNPDHQLIYFGVRAWQTVHWPEGMLGLHTDDEAAAMEPIRYVGADNAMDVTPGRELAERLRRDQQAMPAEHTQDGYSPGFTEGHFENEPPAADQAQPKADAVDSTIDNAVKAATAEPPAEDAKDPPAGKKKATPKKAAKVEPPKTVAQWETYAKDWIKAETDPATLRTRWADEQKLRNAIGVTSTERDPIFDIYLNRLDELTPGE